MNVSTAAMFWLAAPVPLTQPTVKLIFSFLLSYPLAGLLKRVPDARPEYKNIYSIRCVPCATMCPSAPQADLAPFAVSASSTLSASSISGMALAPSSSPPPARTASPT